MDNSEITTTSYVTGTLSIICWILVFTPQWIANYKNKNGEALSLTFLWIWLVGDFFNIAGSIMERLLPTSIALAIYYTIADLVLIVQVYYYRKQNSGSDVENRPLLFGELYNDPEDEDVPIVVRYAVPLGLSAICMILFMICSYPVIVILGWSQYMGWIAAILYITSRIPQIHKNYKNKSVEGLSMMMFIFALAGNILFCVSILTQSINYYFLMKNLPWLVGSGGTLLLDLTIGLQSFMYPTF